VRRDECVAEVQNLVTCLGMFNETNEKLQRNVDQNCSSFSFHKVLICDPTFKVIFRRLYENDIWFVLVYGYSEEKFLPHPLDILNTNTISVSNTVVIQTFHPFIFRKYSD
jgi:hypothetical protein